MGRKSSDVTKALSQPQAAHWGILDQRLPMTNPTLGRNAVPYHLYQLKCSTDSQMLQSEAVSPLHALQLTVQHVLGRRLERYPLIDATKVNLSHSICLR